MTAGSSYRAVVLVGFMGSGKTTVGRLLARRLGWSFVDLDDVIESRAGMAVDAIFRERGEAHFRELEAKAGRETLERDRLVLAPGGGWAVMEGSLEALDGDVLSVWLEVSPEVAVRRARSDGGRVRPLLEGPEPLAKARALLAGREERYRLAGLHLDTEKAEPERLVEEILREMSHTGA